MCLFCKKFRSRFPDRYVINIIVYLPCHERVHRHHDHPGRQDTVVDDQVLWNVWQDHGDLGASLQEEPEPESGGQTLARLLYHEVRVLPPGQATSGHLLVCNWSNVGPDQVLDFHPGHLYAMEFAIRQASMII